VDWTIIFCEDLLGRVYVEEERATIPDFERGKLVGSWIELVELWMALGLLRTPVCYRDLAGE
jgi:hypothetical protein